MNIYIYVLDITLPYVIEILIRFFRDKPDKPRFFVFQVFSSFFFLRCTFLFVAPAGFFTRGFQTKVVLDVVLPSRQGDSPC